MANFKNIFVNRIIESLYRDGMRIIKDASESNNTTMRSGNMEDAYGCAVYYRGVCVKKGYVNPTPKSIETHHGWRKHNIPDNTGRGYLNDFFKGFKPDDQGLTLVCVNAVYYTNILENGAQGRPKIPLSRKYRIISQADIAFDGLKRKYKNSTVRRIGE